MMRFLPSRVASPLLFYLGLFLASGILCGCSIKRFAVNQVGNALAGGAGTYASDNDPQLVREALPFSLKLVESLLAESPCHEGLLLTAASGFTQYAYAFVQQDADRAEDEDFSRAEALRDRALRLYLRARDYGLRGLEVRHHGFREALTSDADAAAELLQKSDVPMVYWTVAAWGAAISVAKDNPALISEQVMVEALLDRALALDETFGRGAIHALLISYEMVRQGAEGAAADRARLHFERAVALSEGKLAGPYVSLAEAVAIQEQDHRAFEELLNQALAIDPDAVPEERLVNLIMQERARWLLSRLDELFLIPENS